MKKITGNIEEKCAKAQKATSRTLGLSWKNLGIREALDLISTRNVSSSNFFSPCTFFHVSVWLINTYLLPVIDEKGYKHEHFHTACQPLFYTLHKNNALIPIATLKGGVGHWSTESVWDKTASMWQAAPEL